MRILRIAPRIYPEASGGGAYHAHAMSRDQAKLGHEVTVLSISKEDTYSKEVSNGYTIINYPSEFDVFRNEISLGILKELVCTDEYDVIHAHSHLRFSTNFAALSRLFNETPLAITNHGLTSQSVPKWVSKAYLRTIGRWTLNRADMVFTYTPEEYNLLKDSGIRSRIKIISNGIDKKRFTSQGEEYEKIDDERFCVLFVGRLFQGKNPRDAVEAVEKLESLEKKPKLVICGDGPLREQLEKYAKERNIIEQIVFLDHVDYEHMPKVYRAADVLLLPSEAEGFPRVVLESLATKTPVITSELEQLVPVVEKAGETAPVGDINEFSEKIRSMIDKKERRERLGNQGRQLIEEKYSWESTVQKTTKALEELVSNSSR